MRIDVERPVRRMASVKYNEGMARTVKSWKRSIQLPPSISHEPCPHQQRRESALRQCHDGD